MRLHLDDRLLHGRILQGWGPRLGTRRYVLVSERWSAAELAARYAAPAAEAGCEIVCPGAAEAAAATWTDEGDFWLTDSASCALGLCRAGARIEALVLIGLRDPGGHRLGEDLAAGESSLQALAELAQRGVRLERQRFPGAASQRLLARELRRP